MKILAIATTNATGSTAIFDDSRLLGERNWSKNFQTNTSHSELFSPALEDLLESTEIPLSQINYIAVDVGPGSFTGIRVGVNAARSLAYSLGVSVIRVDSLTLLAQQAHQQKDKSRPILVAINAFRNLIYAAKFIIQNEIIKMCLEPRAYAPEAFASLLENDLLFIGDAKDIFLKYVSDKECKKITFLDSSPNFSSARTLGPLALRAIQDQETVSWKEVLPLYIRKSEAEEKLGGT
ncbi:MAG: tRNA (adenosine(37)-N6)-threonylcarbamoyltransferase complex dimerization subunit type 1 TsaB [Pseudomonadota bacterium]|nr:tRNA (adenosine(37)-N6)-threonylcarbamoyltransferase complex dimerization subunit type 1 TsaB [Pseudomonadota bacterium]